MGITKQQLLNYRAIVREIAEIKNELETIGDVRASDYSAVRTGQRASLDNAIIRQENLLAFLRRKCERLEAERVAIENAIDQLDGDERLLIRYKYIVGMSWAQIQARLEREPDATFWLHRKTLKKLFELK